MRSTQLHGTVTDTSISFLIDWDNGSRGEYDGAFDGDGRLSGSTFDVANPDSTARWSSDKQF